MDVLTNNLSFNKKKSILRDHTCVLAFGYKTTVAELGHPTFFFQNFLSQDLEILSQDLEIGCQDLEIIISGSRDRMSGSRDNYLRISR